MNLERRVELADLMDNRQFKPVMRLVLLTGFLMRGADCRIEGIPMSSAQALSEIRESD